MKDHLGSFLDRIRVGIKNLREGRYSWVFPFIVLFCASFAALALFFVNWQTNWFSPPVIGHVTKAYGTVKLAGLDRQDQARLESSPDLLVPLHIGDQLQTGEDAAAEVLFYGGSTLQMEQGTVAEFEDLGQDVAIRMVLGRAYFQLPAESSGGRPIVFESADGKQVEVPDGKSLVLTLDAAKKLEDAVDVQVVETDQAPDLFTDPELRYLAHGEESPDSAPLIVPPIESQGRFRPPPVLYAGVLKNIRPTNEEVSNLVGRNSAYFAWDKSAGAASDPVVAYEVVVRPAFGYDVEDEARRRQIFRRKNSHMSMDKVGGGGVFLWSVRAVTKKGERGPASAPRWLEIRFPKTLPPPEIHNRPNIE